MGSDESNRVLHPRLCARGTNGHSVITSRTGVRTIIYMPSSRRQPWVEGELARAGAMVQVGRSIEHVVLALTEDPPPRPQILVVDVDSIMAIDLLRLHSVREGGWFGTIVALGTVPPALRTSLGIAKVLHAPFVEGALVDSLEAHHLAAAARTAQLPVLDEP